MLYATCLGVYPGGCSLEGVYPGLEGVYSGGYSLEGVYPGGYSLEGPALEGVSAGGGSPEGVRHFPSRVYGGYTALPLKGIRWKLNGSPCDSKG